ncbi:MAG TPA: DUF58 domain-containing protein [Actinocrinis sp.]|nr:DUF58 domain-containing protein [Actinocrinis sp.]
MTTQAPGPVPPVPIPNRFPAQAQPGGPVGPPNATGYAPIQAAPGPPAARPAPAKAPKPAKELRYRRGALIVTGRAGLVAAVGAVLVGVSAALAHVSGWIVMCAFEAALAAMIGLDYRQSTSIRDLSFERTGDTTTRLGTTAAVRLGVHNGGSARLRGSVRDSWSPSAGNHTGRPAPAEPRHELDVAPGRAVYVDTVLHPTRRGDHTPDLVTVRTLGPLGLAGRQGSRQIPWRLRVLPPFDSRKHLPSRLARLHETDGTSPVLTRGQGSEFDSLREYVIGDDVRSIDWRATARRNDVVVRTWRPERDRHVVIVLDTGRTSAGRVGDVPKLDSALDAALLLAALATRAGDRVDLLAYDHQVRTYVTGALPGRTLALFSDAMAVLEPALVELNAIGLVKYLSTKVRRRSLIVLLTSIDTAPISEGLLGQIKLLTARHQVLIGSVADPRIAAMATGRGSADAVYGAASAARALSERRRTEGELLKHGVQVVDAVPERFAPDLADKYLFLKSTGRL